MIKKCFSQIEKLVAVDVGCRGLGGGLQLGDFERVVEELYLSDVVMIVTGYCIKDSMTGETDGPLGTASLVNGLYHIGKKAVIVTDEYSVDLVRGCCEVLKLILPIEVVPYKDADEFCSQLLDKYNPTHVVALERPGRARDGGSYSMRGEDLSEFIPNTDEIFWQAQKKGIKTIAIGDGGNEMGMGKIREFITNYVTYGEKICAETTADYLIIAGISNWGGHGITAALSILTSKVLLHKSTEEIRMIGAMIKAGGVDGCTKKSEYTVDGQSLEMNLSILEKLHDIIESSIHGK